MRINDGPGLLHRQAAGDMAILTMKGNQIFPPITTHHSPFAGVGAGKQLLDQLNTLADVIR